MLGYIMMLLCALSWQRDLGAQSLAPEVRPRLDLKHRLFLDRWRKYAAAAILLPGLLPLPATAAAIRNHFIDLPSTQPPRQEIVMPNGPNYFVSAVLLSELYEQLPLDFWINLHLPSGEVIPILTHNGFFGIDLEGKALETDTIVVAVPEVVLEDSTCKMKIESSFFQFRLQQGQNRSKMIHAIVIWKNSVDITIGPAPISIPIHRVAVDVMSTYPEVAEREPLFKTRSAEEKAARRLLRDYQKPHRRRP